MGFGMQGEDIIEHVNGKCHVVYISICERKIVLSVLVLNVICSHFSQLVDHCLKEAKA